MLWSESGIATLREESHPLLVRAGYQRGREFLMLGQRTLAKIRAVVEQESDRGRALERCGVGYIRAGEDLVADWPGGEEVLVRSANYARLLDRAVSVPQPPAAPDPEGRFTPEKFFTPGVKTIAQVVEFTGLRATSQIKSLVMMRQGVPLLVLLRGDHQLSPAKLAGAKLEGARAAEAEEIRQWFGADAGSIGPVGVEGVRILADEALRGRRNLIAGANQNDYHLRNVTPGEDFAAEYLDLRQAMPGDASPSDGAPLEFVRVMRLDDADRILRVAVEHNRDADGMALPAAIAPFTVIVTPLHPERLGAARDIYQRLAAQGFDVLLDDRDARPGVKFKDADLIGIPYRVIVGKKIAEGVVEVVERRSRRSQEVEVGAINIPH